MLLLDSHVLVWWLHDPTKLSKATADEIGRGGDRVFVSAATIWELEIKRAIGKLRFDGDFLTEVDTEVFASLPISMSHAKAAAELPDHHRDPFDRMLVAQARTERLTLVTADERIRLYDVPVLAP